MRLLTHNMLICNVKACVATANRFPEQGPLNFPLKIVPSEENGVEIIETQYSKEFMVSMLTKLDWKALRQTVVDLNHPDLPELPEELPMNAAEDEDLLQKIHSVVFDTNINSGNLVCQNCSRSYPIDNGVPNMLLEEDEM